MSLIRGETNNMETLMCDTCKYDGCEKSNIFHALQPSLIILGCKDYEKVEDNK